MSEVLGEKAWQPSGLGVPADVDTLNQTINHLEQQAIDLRLQLDERDQDLAAARAANRELIAQLNTGDTPNPVPAQHLSDTLKSFPSPLSSANTGAKTRPQGRPPEKMPCCG